MCEAFRLHRGLIVKLAKEIPRLKIVEPKGAFYLFHYVSAYFGKSCNGQTIHNATDLVDYLLGVRQEQDNRTKIVRCDSVYAIVLRKLRLIDQ